MAYKIGTNNLGGIMKKVALLLKVQRYSLSLMIPLIRLKRETLNQSKGKVSRSRRLTLRDCVVAYTPRIAA